MVDERKLKLMTRMALYEEKEGKEDFKISAYYRKDYTSLNTLLSFAWGTVGYVCVLALLGLGGFEFLVGKLSLNLAVILFVVIVIAYFIIVITYAVLANRFYDKKHKQARMRVKKYNHDLTRLLDLYEKEN